MPELKGLNYFIMNSKIHLRVYFLKFSVIKRDLLSKITVSMPFERKRFGDRGIDITSNFNLATYCLYPNNTLSNYFCNPQ